MESKRKASVHPLHPTMSTLCHGWIIQSAAGTELQVEDQSRTAYSIDVQCHLLSNLQPGDQVVFCVLDDGKVAVLNRLISPRDPAKNNLEFALPGVKDSFIRITEQGIQLQAGETKLLISSNGTISLDARNLEQKAQENLRIKGGIVRIN